ncbi:MAG: NADP-dependent oxidoreductase [Gemmatimonadaceae bacterium]
MRQVQYAKFGPAVGFTMAEVPTPTPGEGEVLVDVAAASYNLIDLKISSGKLAFIVGDQFPRAFGADVAGVVSAVGPAAAGFGVGDRVLGSIPVTRSGSFAEQAVLPIANAAHLPASIDFVAGSALPMTGSTALQALADTAGVRQGTRILINGAAGGVGTFAIQIAKALGGTVSATASGAGLDQLRDLGADEVVDYTTTDVAGLGRRLDVVFDTVSSLSREQADGLLVAGGHHIDLNPGPPTTDDLASLHTSQFTQITPERLARLVRMVEVGSVTPVVGLTFGLDDTVRTLAAIESGANRFRGKAVLAI